MTYDEVYSQIITLPQTYLRTGPNFDSLMSSFAYAISRYTDSADFTFTSNMSIKTMDALWLELIGTLTNIPRQNNITTTQYRNQIASIVEEPQVTPNAIINYLKSVEITTTYQDDFSGPGDFSTFGYKIMLQTPQTNYNNVALMLGRVRPAGVPFNPLYIVSGGMYLTSITYLGNWRVTGSYLMSSSNTYYFTIPSTTNNNSSLIPTQFLTNPVINPSL